MIDYMAKPTEVLISIGEDGEVEEEFLEDTETIFLFDRMRETLIFMTHIDSQAMNQLI
jgi:exportin-1